MPHSLTWLAGLTVGAEDFLAAVLRRPHSRSGWWIPTARSASPARPQSRRWGMTAGRNARLRCRRRVVKRSRASRSGSFAPTARYSLCRTSRCPSRWPKDAVSSWPSPTRRSARARSSCVAGMRRSLGPTAGRKPRGRGGIEGCVRGDRQRGRPRDRTAAGRGVALRTRRYGDGHRRVGRGSASIPALKQCGRWTAPRSAPRSSGPAGKDRGLRRLPGVIAGAARGTGICACAGAPIIVDGAVWGAMSAHSTDDEPLPDHIEDRLADSASPTATAISNITSR